MPSIRRRSVRWIIFRWWEGYWEIIARAKKPEVDTVTPPLLTLYVTNPENPDQPVPWKVAVSCQNIEIRIRLFCRQYDMDILSCGLSYIPLAPSLQGIDSRIVNDQATPNDYLEMASIGGWIVRCICSGGVNCGETSQIYFSSENSRK